MFSLFRKECVVNPNDKEWIENTFIWLFGYFGREELLSYESISPEIFKEGIGKTRSQFADILFEKIRISYRIPPLDFQIVYNQNQESEIDGVGALIGPVGKGEAAWSTFTDEKLTINLQDTTLKDLDLLASNISYFLCLHKLKQICKLENVNGYNAEVAAFFFGSGVFISNSIITHGQWSGVRMYGWSVGSRGHLTQQMAGYIYSLISFLKKDSEPPFMTYFCPDVKRYIEQSNKYIDQEKYFYDDLSNKLNNISEKEAPDYYHEQYEYYDRKILRSVSEMKNGKRNGLTKYYHPNGALWAEWEFKNDVPWNIFCSFNDKSEPVEKGTLIDGTGKVISYNEYGEIAFTQNYESGILKNTEKLSDSPFYK
jgi:hypothetical protein